MKPEHRSLRDVFETIADEARNNPVRHIVALTYEFDDQQLINLLVGRPLDELYEPCGFDLKRIAELTPVVVYDARKTREGQATPHFLELLPVQMPAYTCHHPKALLVVLERSIHLVIGSMNLTRTGLLTNREVFLHLRCNRLETADATVFQEFFSLLESGYASFESEPLARTIAAARDRLAIWNQTAVSTQHLVSSGYGNTGMECMRRLWSEDGRGPALAVLAVSPFFDRASSRRILASELRANFGHFDKLTLVTDASARAHLARSHFAQVAEPVLQLVPAELSQAEMERIARSNDLADLGQRIIQRKLHGKVLALHDGARTLLYVGSANFTCKAWLGENQELGVAWFVDGPWTELVDQICAGFSAAPANVFSFLGDQPDEEAQEDEDYESCAMWPDFVQGVTLEYTVNRQALQFMVRGQELHRLSQYEVYWGRERLFFDAGVSQPLAASTLFGRLLGGRNLAFRPLALPETQHWIPFRHDPKLFAERASMVHLSAEEWMSYQLGLESSSPLHPNEFDPDGEESDDDSDSDEEEISYVRGDREANAMVRMQTYLSLFARIEHDLVRRAQAVLARPEHERESAWRDEVAAPLRTLTRVLGRTAGSMSEAEAVFKLGELLQLRRELAHLAPSLPTPDIFALWNTVPVHPSLKDYLDEWRERDGAAV